MRNGGNGESESRCFYDVTPLACGELVVQLVLAEFGKLFFFTVHLLFFFLCLSRRSTVSSNISYKHRILHSLTVIDDDRRL